MVNTGHAAEFVGVGVGAGKGGGGGVEAVDTFSGCACFLLVA